MNWFRVPSFLAKEYREDRAATDQEAWLEVLGRWHGGEDVSCNRLAEILHWGKGRTMRFLPQVARWANANGGTVPPRWQNCTERTALRTESGPETDRTTDRPDTGATSHVLEQRTGNGPHTSTKADRKRTGSNSSPEREEKEQIREESEGEAQVVVETPTAPTQTIIGPQATVILPEPPLVESPLLSLLASSGMPMGQAASVARKFLEAGITSPVCEEAMVLDEFDLGRLAGPHKGRVVVAFRRAGWLPPKERRHQTIPALPPGLKVIDEKGNPIASPSSARSTKSEKAIDALQQRRSTIQEEESDGQRNISH